MSDLVIIPISMGAPVKVAIGLVQLAMQLPGPGGIVALSSLSLMSMECGV